MTSIDPLNMRDLASQNRQQTSTWNLEDLPPMNLYDYLGNGNVKMWQTHARINSRMYGTIYLALLKLLQRRAGCGP